MNIIFNPVNSCSSPMTGSKITLRYYSPPGVTGSNFGAGVPVSQYTDYVTGSALFSNVIPGYYKVSVSTANANNNSVNGNYNNFENLVY